MNSGIKKNKEGARMREDQLREFFSNNKTPVTEKIRNTNAHQMIKSIVLMDHISASVTSRASIFLEPLLASTQKDPLLKLWSQKDTLEERKPCADSAFKTRSC
jgi:hypothetical protein